MFFALTPQPWRALAGCRDAPNPDVFFPRSTRPGGRHEREAKRTCSSCPVAVECRAEGMRPLNLLSVDSGIYGGMTARERIELAGRRRSDEEGRSPVSETQGWLKQEFERAKGRSEGVPSQARPIVVRGSLSTAHSVRETRGGE